MLFLLQDVTTFYLTGFDLAAVLDGIFTEAAVTCLFMFCVQKLIQHWCSQREQIFSTEKDGLVFTVSSLKKKNKSIAIYIPRDEKYLFKNICSALDQTISATFAPSHSPLPGASSCS